MTGKGIGHISGPAAVLMIDHVDTDQIIPSREMKKVGRDGLGEGLFAHWRYSDLQTREPNADFVLNTDLAKDAPFLVSGQNFGCGSSREHAVWALADFGFQVIVADGFGAIFRGNCVRNGILPVALPGGEHRSWKTGDVLTLDLEEQTIGQAGKTTSFDIDPYSKLLLATGLDPIDLARQQTALI
ncbi:MAG: 3-isopropylmalate dehydratase small subunit, partial [Parvularcula sp.]|nr:3-isopropylmalate dehydratase small subunit [Parvularcula sp.]